jgi:hypothetical protein
VDAERGEREGLVRGDSPFDAYGYTRGNARRREEEGGEKYGEEGEEGGEWGAL